MEACVGDGIPNRGLKCLLFYREKYKQYKLGIGLYNMLLGGFAEPANLPKINEVLKISKADGNKCNAQSYAAIFECFGRMKDTIENLKLLREFQDEAAKNVNSMKVNQRTNIMSFPFFYRVSP